MIGRRTGWMAGGAMAVAVLASTGAWAQNTGCGDLGNLLKQRQTIAGQLTGKGKKLDAGLACTGFGQLVNNGNTIIKWAEANKDWCQVPDSFVESVKADHAKAISIRVKACGMVQQQAKAEKQAREGGGGGLLGGGGLTGPTRLPQGAL